MRKIITVTMLLMLSLSLSATEIGGAKLPETLAAGSEQLTLNGAGLRKKFFIKIYAGALYLKSKSSNGAALIAADEAMAIRMHFLYGLKPEQLTEAFAEGFEAALGSDMAKHAEAILAFNKLFSQKTEKGDTYDIIYVPGKGTEVLFNGTSQGIVEGLDIKKAVFSIWLADKVVDSNLESVKKAMLGN